MRKIIALSTFALLLVLSLSSCRYKLKDRPNWDTEITAPLVNSNVTVADLLQDSSLVTINPDQSLTVVYRDTVMNFELNEYVEVPDSQVSVSVSLETLRLSSGEICENINIAEIARQIGLGGLIPLGFFPATVPPQTGLSSGPVPIDAGGYFTEADLVDGWLIISIENQLPTDIDSVIFELRLDSDNSVVVSDTLFNIQPGVTAVDSTFMGGKHVESMMTGEVVSARTGSIPAGTPIDSTSQYLEICVIMDSLQASYAEAVFPGQTVIDNGANVKYFFGNGIEITRMGVRSGRLEVHAFSTIANPLQFTYELPTAIKDGQPVEVSALLPAAAGPGNPSRVDTIFNLDGHEIDLTVNGDSVNLFPQHIIGELIYTGNLVKIGLDDSIKIDYGLLDIIPEYIEGYIGTDTFRVSDTTLFTIFNQIESGTMDLKDPRVSITFLNSIGVDGELVVNQFSAHNTRTNTTVALNATPLSNPLTVSGPRLPNYGQVVSTSIELTEGNSNIDQFLSNMPDELRVDLEVQANKYSFPSLHENFATYESAITALLDLEVPLHGITNNLTLVDTSGMNLESVSLPDALEEMELKLIVENTFPFRTNMQMYFLDNTYLTVDSLFTQGSVTVPSGVVDANGIVIEPGKTVLAANFTQGRLNSFINQVAYARSRFSITTQPDNTDVKIYSNYGITFKLVGDFRAKVGD